MSSTACATIRILYFPGDTDPDDTDVGHAICAVLTLDESLTGPRIETSRDRLCLRLEHSLNHHFAANGKKHTEMSEDELKALTRESVSWAMEDFTDFDRGIHGGNSTLSVELKDDIALCTTLEAFDRPFSQSHTDAVGILWTGSFVAKTRDTQGAQRMVAHHPDRCLYFCRAGNPVSI